MEGGESDRDVFNEKPSRDEILAATQVSNYGPEFARTGAPQSAVLANALTIQSKEQVPVLGNLRGRTQRLSESFYPIRKQSR
ncbi:Peptidylprolyl isomerase domain and WD repeat containing protein 1 [Desmophyllum pertusum]|uniref:Peptidylprolyl isomerase domain and WD repeat containing protein 1 n=1 Tax=Desmophyllum pertusum TaxID=174260 RepID=A0A9X0D1N8_9CNID|nr:Peptidylprolyl isomerase domain and WD repeat containing protein 1 [Desmophyllum pertusum]